ncbi:hypothetical protein FF1_012972 [Malus domestica]
MRKPPTPRGAHATLTCLFWFHCPFDFAMFIVHLATIPITGTGINPARSFGTVMIYNNDKIWADHWIFWVRPFVGALAVVEYHQYILRAAALKVLGSFRSNPTN